ncbi:MAG: zinc-ribbon domain-containing protein [Chloroflexi bacterium]|nr:zinc-ribbon domain-containing protein [Chloroflexota bacterium]
MCPNCNRYVSNNYRFCLYYGETLIEVAGYHCVKCGKDVEDDWKACPHCGKSL